MCQKDTEKKKKKSGNIAMVKIRKKKSKKSKKIRKRNCVREIWNCNEADDIIILLLLYSLGVSSRRLLLVASLEPNKLLIR